MFGSDKTQTAEPIQGVTKKQIYDHCNAGGSVYICTHLKSWLINKKAITRWENAGCELLKETAGSLYMGRGKHYDCIDYCHILFK